MHVYIAHSNSFFSVGHYAPDGTFIPESDYGLREQAAERVAFLNGTVFPSPATQADEPTPPVSTKILRSNDDHFRISLDDGTTFSVRVISSGISVYKFDNSEHRTPMSITLAADNHVTIK